MNLKNKILFSTTFLISLFFIILIFFWQYNTQKLETLQKIRINEFQSTFNEVLSFKSSPYKIINYDYSYWDELINFVKTKDEVWAKFNLEEPMHNYKFDYTLVYDNHKNLIYYNQYDSKLASLKNKIPLSTLDSKKVFFSNYFLLIDGKLIQIFSAPIQPSIDTYRKTAPQGYYVIGKIWDKAYIDDLENITKQSISITSETGNYDFFYPLLSYDKKHIAHLGITLNSTTTDIVNHIFKNQLYLIFIMGLIFLFFLGNILFRTIIRPLKEITDTINNKESEKLSKLLAQKDEIGEVARAIDDYFIQTERIIRQTTDPLTGLPNRQQLTEDLEIKGVKQLLMLINIKKFRNINESYGYDIGDTILQIFSKRLTSILENHEKAYRVSADEFAILSLENYEEKIQLKRSKIIRCIENDPFSIGELKLNINVFIALAQGDENLRRKCDIALHYAKEHNISFINFNTNTQIVDELQKSKELTAMIQKAITKKQIKPFGQKIHNILDNSYKIETLMRIIDEHNRIISPTIFLEQSKIAGLYTQLTLQMMEGVFEHFRHNTLDFSINITFEDMLNYEVTSYFFNSIKTYKMQGRVIIELVESERIDSSNSEICQFIQKAKEFGCRISIDDFGSGYSNFNYLVNMKANFLKIDGSLIQNIDTDDNAYLTVKSIVSLAKELNIKVVAEFIHSENIFDIVRSLDIELFQGNYLHEAEPIQNII